MRKKYIFLIVGIILVVVATGITGIITVMNHPFRIEKNTYLYIDADDNTDSICHKLTTQLQASSLKGFKLLTTVGGLDPIHPGAYRFTQSDNCLTVYRRLKSGAQTPVNLTLPSVRTIGKLLKTVSHQLMTDSSNLARLLMDSTYCAQIGYSTETLPCLFIPNTYEVYWTMTPEAFVKRMQKEHDRFWNKERKAKAQSIGLTPEEVVTLASIVEEETANNAEKPMVAGLYMNRLHAEMPLQADPTVKFALQDFELRRILHAHLETESPYNTYKHTGLPPGPIRIPSIQGIESVLNYTRHDYLYMCAKEDFSGTHNFAATFTQHLANARKYQQELNRRKIK
ncbi:endolytic transglycosylase MltG [Phocaeicola barnesiae]